MPFDPFAPKDYVRAMALRPILVLPEPLLRKVSDPVPEVDAAVRALVDDMFETMYEAPGIGLAAIQIGVPKRIVTIDLARKEEPPARQVFINPEIVWASEDLSSYEEGCLSIPSLYEEVERPARIRVRYLDVDGKPQEIEADGLLATCLQHEIDHLEGKLFVDRLSRLKRERALKRWQKARRENDA